MDAVAAEQLSCDGCYLCVRTDSNASCNQTVCQRERNIECYISLEERMACGIGGMSCLRMQVEGRKMDHSHVHNKRICKDGPVFLSTEVEI